jgi:hypothetical protein
MKEVTPLQTDQLRHGIVPAGLTSQETRCGKTFESDGTEKAVIHRHPGSHSDFYYVECPCGAEGVVFEVEL